MIILLLEVLGLVKAMKTLRSDTEAIITGGNAFAEFVVSEWPLQKVTI